MSELKKLLYIISDDNYFLSHRLNLARAARDAGYDVSVLAYKNDPAFVDKIEAEGFQFYPLSLRAQGLGVISNIKLIFQIRRGIQKIVPDLIHTVSIRMVLLTTIAFWMSKAKRLVATLTGMGFLETSKKLSTLIIKSMVLFVFRQLFKSKGIRLVVQNSDDYKLVKNRLIDESRLHLVKGSGVSLSDFSVLDFPSFETIHVTFVARMLRDKGLMELIEAARIIHAQGIQNIKIHLIGDPHKVNPFSVSRQQLQDWDNKGWVQWHGFRKDIVDVWKQSHIAVLPSYREGLPKSLLEAAACGRPIITTDVPGCREMVNSKNGVLVPVCDAESLATAIIEMSKDNSEIQRMGAESREWVESEFSDQIVNKKMLDIYQQCK